MGYREVIQADRPSIYWSLGDSHQPSVSDTFTRADSLTTLGNADTGQAWSAAGGTWGINSNQAYLPSPANTNAAWIDGGLSDFVFTCDMKFEDAGDGIMFRGTGAAVDDGFLFYLDTGAAHLLVPGFGSSLFNVGGTYTVGTTYTMKVLTSSTTLQCSINGSLIGSVSSGTNLTSTHVGLRSGGSTAAKRWDTLSVFPTELTIIKDSSGHGISAGVVSASYGVPGPYGLGNAVGFTGSPLSYIQAVSPSDPGDTCSYEVWVRRGATGVLASIISSVAGGFFLRFNADNTIHMLRSQVVDALGTTDTYTDLSKYYHVVCTNHPTIGRFIWVNGKLSASSLGASTGFGNSGVLLLNTEGTGHGDPSTQKLAQFAMYNYQLSPAQVLNHYLAGANLLGQS